MDRKKKKKKEREAGASDASLDWAKRAKRERLLSRIDR